MYRFLPISLGDKMNAKRFNDLVLDYQSRCRGVLIDKAKEYATNDERLANFKRAAELGNCTPIEALVGMMRKHWVSIEFMAKEPTIFTRAQWDEKFIDIMNYSLLGLACVEDMKLFKNNSSKYFFAYILIPY